VNEDYRAEIGRGHEFPTQLFKSHYNLPAYELAEVDFGIRLSAY
jgi:hypothetical protein